MFYGCSGLTSLDLSGFDTSQVTDMGGMFYGCSGLTSLDLSGFDTSQVTDMGGMFNGCSGLTSLNLSGLDTSHVTIMTSMFEGCSGLTSLDLSGFDTSQVTDMGGMFNGCSGLTSLNLSGLDTSHVTIMTSMFEGCSGLTSLNLSGLDTSHVTIMMSMFEGCSGLTSLDLSGFDTSHVTDMVQMFNGCSGLTSLDLSGFDTSQVTYMWSMFNGCSGLTSLNLSGLDTSQVTIMMSMFYGCSGLTSLDLSSFDTSHVTDMRSMFYVCSGLTSMDLSGFDTSQVTDIWGMFCGCSGLTSLDLSSFDTSQVTDMKAVFYGCSGLTSLDLSGFNTSQVTDMTDMFFGCSSLTSIQSPYYVKVSAGLPKPDDTVWRTPDGTEVTELPMNLDYSILLTRYNKTPQIISTTTEINSDSVIRVKYVPFSYYVKTNNDDKDNLVTYSMESGSLPAGLTFDTATGEISGVPMEAGTFRVYIKATFSKGTPDAYADLELTIKENSGDNIAAATDAGYDITKTMEDFDLNNTGTENRWSMVSMGTFSEFRRLYLDGIQLTRDVDYTAEEGSTRIVILTQTLSGLQTGIHTLSLEFNNSEGSLKRAAQNFNVTNSGSSGEDDPNPNPNDDDDPDPDPGDNDDSDPDDDGQDDENSGNQNGIGRNGSGSSAGNSSEDMDVIIYTVMPGDHLWGIAVKFYGVGDYWRKIYADNAAVIRNPGRIYAGQRLTIYLQKQETKAEAATEEGVYRVTSRDNLWSIAQVLYGDGRLWRRIYDVNRDTITNPGRIYAGQQLKIPAR